MGGIISSSEEKFVSLTARHVMPAYYIEKELTDEDCQIVRNSWSVVLDGDLLIFYEVFYDRLFETHPTVKHLFKKDMIIQAKALVQMISVTLQVLKNPSKLENILTDLAKRHTGYGVIATQYCYIGEVLLWSLEIFLKEKFTPEVELSWLTTYNHMLKIMIPAAVAEERKVFRDLEQISRTVKKQDSSATICLPLAP
jgi:hemoglobin-like flavoprotein